MKFEISNQIVDSALNKTLPRENIPAFKAPIKGRIELLIDGVKFTGNPLPNGKPIRLKKKDQDLLIEVEGQPIGVIENFYATEGLILDGENWLFSEVESLKLTDSGVTAVPEAIGTSTLVPIAAAGAGGLVGAALAGLGLAALAGGGGGGGVDSTTAQTAINLIAAAANANNATSNTLTAQTYTDAGVTGVSSTNLAAINSVLNTDAVTGAQVGTVSGIQNIVNTYNKILALADAGGTVTPNAAKPQAGDYAGLGLSGFTGADAASKANFLGDLIDRKQAADVSSADALQTLANQVSAILGYTNTSPQSAKPTVEQIISLLPPAGNGQTPPVVNGNNLAAVQAAIASANSDGTPIASLAELSSITTAAIAKYDAAMAIIAAYADSSSNPAPSVQDYADAGITGVTPGNLADVNRQIDGANRDTANDASEVQGLVNAIIPINAAVASIAQAAQDNNANGTTVPLSLLQSAGIQNLSNLNLPLLQGLLNTASINGQAVDSVADIQALVDAVQLVQQLANGTNNSTTPALNAAQITALGLQSVLNNDSERALFTDVLDRAVFTAADEASELIALAAIVDRINQTAANTPPNPPLSAQEFTQLGLQNIDANRITQLRAAIEASANDGTGVRSLAQLQTQVNNVNLSNEQASLTVSEADGGIGASEVANGVVLSVSLPANVREGQVIKLVLTSPEANIPAITVTHAITAADIAAGQVALTLGAAQFKNNNAFVDGSYTLQSTVFDSTLTNALTTPFAITLALDTTAPNVTVLSIAGNATTTNQTGEFDAAERGISATDVASPVVISGSTDAQAGNTVMVTLNGKNYSATVVAGSNNTNTWSVTLPAADAIALVHGSTYNVQVQAQDTAGNITSNNNTFKLQVNTAQPDIPTIHALNTSATTPILTGKALKILDPNGITTDPNNYIPLANTDSIDIKIGTTTLYSFSVAGGNGFSYNPSNQTWSLNTSAVPGFTALSDGSYNVSVTVTAGNMSKSDRSSNELVVKTAPPTLTLNPMALDNLVNATEKNQDIVLSGSTDAAVGTTVTTTFNGNTYTGTVVAVSSGNNAANTFSITLPRSAVSAISAEGTQSLTLSLTNEFGVANSLSRNFTYDTVAPTAPTVSVAELLNDVSLAEITDGLQASVTLPAGTVAGDKVIFTITRPDGTVGTFETTLSGSFSNPASITVPQDILSAQGAMPVDGSYSLNAFIRDAAGNVGSAGASQTFTLDQTAPGQNADGSPAAAPKPVLAIAEAAGGINATELADGIQAAVTLPTGSVVGDKLTFTLTGPGGALQTHVYTLNNDDLTSGSAVIVTLPQNLVTVDGNYTLTAVSTDKAGNSSTVSTPLGFGLAAALTALQAAADSNTASPSTTPLSTFTNAGVSGIGGTNQPSLDAINSALNSPALNASSIDTVAKLQAVVDAYQAILNNATSSNPANSVTNPTAQQYTAIGVTGIDTDPETRLLGNIIDRQAPSAVALTSQIQGLASAVQRVMDGTATLADLVALGVSNATSENLPAVQAALQDTPDASLDTLVKLQNAVDAGIGAYTSAVTTLSTYAQNNAGTAPTLDAYQGAGVTGINGNNQPTVAMVNSVLASMPITAAEADTRTDIQKIVDAYKAILDNANNASSPDATRDQYLAIGVNVTHPTEVISLLGQVIDAKDSADVATQTQIQALANAVQSVMDGNPSLTQLTLLGVTGVTESSLPAVQAALDRAVDATQLNTLTGLQTVVSTAANTSTAAANKIGNYAQDDGVNPSTNPAPVLSDYTALGITGVGGANPQPSVDMLNSALRDPDVQRDQANTQGKVQSIVDAYQAVLSAADGNPNNTPAVLTAAQYSALGVNGVTGTDPATGVLKLLNDTVSAKATADVATADHIQALANAAIAVLGAASNGTPGTAAPTWTQLGLLGLTGVTSDNQAAVLAAMAAKPSTDLDSRTELSTVVASVISAYTDAVNAIQTYATTNTATANPTGTAPTLAHFAAAGVTGVKNVTGPVGLNNNLAAINDALATLAVGADQTATGPKIQAIVNAYNKVFTLADGGSSAGTALTPEEFALIGASIGSAATDTQNLALLNSILDKQSATGVDSIADINDLARIANAIQATANGLSPSPGLNAADLVKVGISGVTDSPIPGNLNAVLATIAAQADDGSATQTLDSLQTLANSAIASLGVITGYADNNGVDTTAHPAPTAQDFANIGVTGLTGTANTSGLSDGNWLATLHNLLATSGITGTQVDTASEVQAILNGYSRVLRAADGNDGNLTTGGATAPTAADYTALGITGLAGADASAKAVFLNDVIDGKSKAQVDDQSDLQTLANAVTQVLGYTSNSGNAAQPTADQINTLIPNGQTVPVVNPDNLAAVQAAIAAANSDGTVLANQSELNTVVTSAIGAYTNAVNTIKTYAGDSTANAPTVANFQAAGVTGVSDGTHNSGGANLPNNLAAVQSALATAGVGSDEADTGPEIQAIVNAYNKVFALADGGTSAGTALTAGEFAKLGANIGDAANTTTGADNLALLNSILDKQSATGVDSIADINDLARIANAIQTTAAGGTPSQALTAADFHKIGLTDVTPGSSTSTPPGNLADLLAAIVAKNDNGSETDSLSDLLAVFNASLSVAITSISDDKGFSTSDFLTNDTTLVIGGTSTAKPGSIIQVIIDAGSALFATVQSNGTWSVDASGTPLTAGSHTLQAAIVSAANSSATVLKSASNVSVSIDTSATLNADGTTDTSVSGKVLAITGISPDSGVANDFKTNATSNVTVRGTSTAAVGAHIAVEMAGTTRYTTVDADGNWQTTFSTLSAGSSTITARLEDAFGNVVQSQTQALTVDTTALTLIGETTGDIAINANLVLTFSAPVVAQGGKTITLFRASDDSVLEALSVTDTSRVTISGNTVTINPTGDLVASTAYYAQIDAGAFVSTTASYVGLNDKTTWTFTGRSFATSVEFGGTGIDANNGINSAELANANLKIAGTLNGSAINTAITKIQFVPTDGSTPFELISGLPTIGSDGTWSLARDNSWTSQLVSGKTYKVDVTLQGTVNGVVQTIMSSSANTLIDTTAPTLSSLSAVTGVAGGVTATEATGFDGLYTFTAENGASVRFIFTDRNNNTVAKTLTGTGSSQKISLTNSELAGLAEGTITVSTTATDAVGNPTTASDVQFTLDTTAPTTLTGLAVSPSGGTVVANTLNSTNTALAFSATIGAGQASGGKAEFYIGNTLIGTSGTIGNTDTTVSYSTSDGTPTSAELQAAINAGGTVSVKLLDAAGSSLTVTGPTLTRDVTAPNAPTLAPWASDISNGATAAEATNTDGIFTLTAEQGATVDATFSRNGNTVTQSVTGAGAGTSVKVILDAADLATLGDGTINVSVVAKDTAGNASEASNTSFTLDTSAPTATLTAASLQNTASATVRSSETGTAYLVKTGGTNAITVSNLASITGAADVRVNSVALNAANSDTSLSLSGLEEGVYTLYTVDAAGNLSAAANNTITIDNTKPATPVVALGTGVSGGATPSEATQSGGVITVTAENGTSVVVTFTDSSTPARTVTKTFTGNGSAQAVALLPTDLGTGTGQLVGGTISYTVTATDVASNPSDTASGNFTFDTTSVISGYAADNGVNLAANPTPTALDYSALGITGINGTNQPTVAMINAALATATITGAGADERSEVQGMVDAYQVILNNANAADRTAAGGVANATVQQYLDIGVTGMNETHEANLLGDVIDGKALADVDTVGAIQALATAVQAVMDANASKAQLDALGVTGVTPENLQAVQAALAAVSDDATQLNTLAKVQTVVNNAVTAYNTASTKIADYADDNGAANPVPILSDYSALGVTGIGGTHTNGSAQPTVAMINTALATATIARAGANERSEVQGMVDAYQVILNNANAADRTAAGGVVNATAQQYTDIGITGVSGIHSSQRASLLGDVIDGKAQNDVETASAIQALANITNAIQDRAAGGTTAISVADLTSIGLNTTDLTNNNLPKLLADIALTNDNGSGVDTLSDLQALIDALDKTPPTAVDLDSATAGTQNTQSLIYKADDAGTAKTLLPNIANSGDTDIATLQISVGGTGLNGAQDQLILGADTISLNTSAQNGSETVTVGAGTVAVTWSYSSAKVLSLTKTGGGNFTAAEVQAIEQALQFKNTATAAAATQGERTLTLSRIDGSGNASTSATITTTLDTSITAAPTGTHTVAIGNDTGTNNSDRITNDSAVQVSVTLANSLTLATDETFQVSANGGATWVNTTGTGTAWATADNAVNLSSTGNITARILDAAGNSRAVTLTSNGYTLDTSITAAPTGTHTVAIGNDTGTNNSDRITNDSAVRVSVTLANSLTLATDETFQVSANGGSTWVNTTGTGTAWATADNAVNLSSTGNITARILDAAGNSRAVTIASNGYTLDTQGPTVTAITDNTPGTATGVVNYTFNFSEDVGASFTAADITASGGATISNFIKVSPTQYTADITPPFGTGTMLVDVTTGSFQDIAGNVNTADTTANSQLYNISRAGQSVIDLGAFGKLIAPVQVEGKWYYVLDRNGDGLHTTTAVGNVFDITTLDYLEQTFVGSSGQLISESNRTFTINGVTVALPTDGNISSTSHFQVSTSFTGTYNPASPGTSAATPGAGYYYATGTLGTAGAGTTTNAGYDDLLAIWDATNATATNSGEQGGQSYTGTPTGWAAGRYWSATGSYSGHAGVNLFNGQVTNNTDSSFAYVALQVL